jgi:hypothetical protein
VRTGSIAVPDIKAHKRSGDAPNGTPAAGTHGIDAAVARGARGADCLSDHQIQLAARLERFAGDTVSARDTVSEKKLTFSPDQ